MSFHSAAICSKLTAGYSTGDSPFNVFRLQTSLRHADPLVGTILGTAPDDRHRLEARRTTE